MDEQKVDDQFHQRLQRGTLGKATGLSEAEINDITKKLREEGLDQDQIAKAVKDQVNQRIGSG